MCGGIMCTRRRLCVRGEFFSRDILLGGVWDEADVLKQP